MKVRTLLAATLIGILIAGPEYAHPVEPDSAVADLKLSPELLDLLRAEMREVSGGVQAMTFFVASGDWEAIEETSANIRASYIMEKKLTPDQAAELEAAIPERFRVLDADFHHRAEKVGAATAAHDAELVVFQYSRMLEGCAGCHSEFARSRFPGFASETHPVHRH